MTCKAAATKATKLKTTTTNQSPNSPFVGAEIIIKSMVRGYPIGEVGIKTYPRNFGESHSTSIKNIIASIRDMFRVYKEIFKQYEI